MTILDDFKKHLDHITDVQKEELKSFFKSDVPKGWVNVNEHLPSFLAKDVMQGYSIYKVKDERGNVFESKVTDSNFWYYESLNFGITHWLNEK